MSSGDVLLTSATGILSLLDEQDEVLQIHALDQLNALVEQFWHEIATAIPKIETLYENETFKSRDLAAVVASKVFYHLEELDDALKYALGAGQLFDVAAKSEYVETLVSKCIDEYIRVRQLQYEAEHGNKQAEAVQIDSRLIAIVERMFSRCYDDGEFHQALGIAIESKRLDHVSSSITRSHDVKGMLSYAYQLSQTLVLSHAFKRELLQTLVQLYSTQSTPDYLNVCQCLLFLNDSAQVAKILNSLVEPEPRGEHETSALMAYQIAFDLGENQNQAFLDQVSAALPLAQPTPAPAASTETPSETPAAADASTPATTDSSAMAVDSAPVTADIQPNAYEQRLIRLRSILSGVVTTRHELQFLFEKNATDLNILKQIKDKLEPRNSVTHNATVMAHALMHSGTTIDVFLRDNLDWLGKAQNWAKFTATASIGVIHKGHIDESRKLLDPYLPSGGQAGSPYQEGGALYALGLVHQSHGASQVQFLSEALRNAGSNEIVQHGACLGLGIAAMATANQDIFEALKQVVMSESAVAGEAAGYAMGLVLLGSGNGLAIEEMLAYAHDTTHEKIVRGLSMGIALINYAREEEADVAIEQLMADKDPILRYGAMYSIGLAYACTGNNAAIQKLLHVAVSDVNDDVRRAAVTCLGFVLANLPEQVPRVVALLAESYNPHVRYGAAMAVGIACAGGATAAIRTEALGVLEPLIKDRVDFVRQGAFIGMAMVLIQHNEQSEPKLAVLRKSITDAMNVKSDTMTKLGAILSAGILDAGGRNVNISLMSASGHRKQAAIVGLAMFPQFWYWYPLVHFLSLAFTPTATIGLNSNLELPQGFTVVSKSPKSLYDYPPPIDLNKKEEKKEVKHNTLSVTAKVLAKARRKEDEEKKASGEDVPMTPSNEAKTDSMEVDEETKTSDESADKTEAKTDEAAVKPAEPELPFHILSNPARVTLAQRSTLMFPKSQRYQPIKSNLTGFVMLNDTKPDEPEVLVTAKTPKLGVPGVSDDEPQPPKPFEYRGN